MPNPRKPRTFIPRNIPAIQYIVPRVPNRTLDCTNNHTFFEQSTHVSFVPRQIFSMDAVATALPNHAICQGNCTIYSMKIFIYLFYEAVVHELVEKIIH